MVEISPLPTGFDGAVIEEAIEVSNVAEPEVAPAPAVDLRERLRETHRDRDLTLVERDRLALALERARVELQCCLDVQADRERAHAAALAQAVDVRTRALLDAVEVEVAELPPAGADDAELSARIATARAVEERVTAKLGEAEAALRRAESRVRSTATGLLIESGERLAIELEAIEAEARDRRASLVALAGLWVDDGGGRARPLQIGPRAHWLLTDGNVNEPEAVRGTRAQIAARIGHVLPPELPAPDWQATLAQLMGDPEAELP